MNNDDEKPPPSLSGRWKRVEEKWSQAGLGEEPPEWLEEYVTQTELTIADLNGLPARDAWTILCDAYAVAQAPPPPASLQPCANAIVAAILSLAGRGTDR